MIDAGDQQVRSAPQRTAVVVVHGVGDTSPGETLDVVVGGLAADDSRPLHTWSFRRHYRFEEDEVVSAANRPSWLMQLLGRRYDGRFNVYSHELRFADESEAVIHELHWADVRGLDTGGWLVFFGIFRALFETPHVIDALLLQRRDALSFALRSLLLYASCFLRGPLAAFSVTLFGGGLLFWLYNYVPDREWTNATLHNLGLPLDETIPKFPLYEWYLIAGLIGGAIFGFWTFLARRHTESSWADLGLFTTLVTVLIAIDAGLVLGLDWSQPNQAHLALLARYFPILAILWLVWASLMTLAVLTYILMFFKDLLTGARPEPKGGGAAISLAFLQAFLWLTALPAVGIVHFQMIRGLFALPSDRERLENADIAVRSALNAQPRGFLDYMSWQSEVASHGVVAHFNRDLGEITASFLLNGTIVFAAAAAVCVLGLIRILVARTSRRDPEEVARRLPRLIVHPSVLLFLLFVGLAQAALFLASPVIDRPTVPVIFGLWLASGLIVLAPVLWGLFSAPVQGVVHIAQDLIDHTYRPRVGISAYLMRPEMRVAEDVYPRRERIAARMRILVDQLIKGHGYDTVLFLAHSQGTVVVHDYLRKAASEGPMLGQFRPNVVTLGSPLSHLYEHYFDEYRDLPQQLAAIAPNIGSWINIYRCDDAIAGPICAQASTIVENRALGYGGHLRYWADVAVTKAIEDSLRLRPRKT